MHVLILGGTAWLGSEIAAYAVGSGHRVTALARGASGPPPQGAVFVAADRDEPDTFGGLGRSEFDLVVDLARQPGQVRRAVEALEDRCARYTFVSSGSVYADHDRIGANEDADLLPALVGDEMVTMADYGHAKVACEQQVQARLGADRCRIVRAGLIGGPGDDSDRSSYWPRRFAKPAADDGSVLVPDDPDLPTQIIDVRDLARWIVDSDASGTFDATGDQFRFADHLEVAREVAGHRGRLAAAPNSWLLDHDVEPWMGPRSFPLWIPDPDWVGMGGRDNSRAHAAGLVPRPLADTLADTLAWERTREPGERYAGLSDADELALLAALSAR